MEDVGLGRRALGMMQVLAGAYANGESPEGTARGIVDRRTAIDALMQLFAVIDEPLQDGRIPENRGLHGMSMLMLVREYVLALPEPPGDEPLLRQDLQELVDALATARKDTGLS